LVGIGFVMGDSASKSVWKMGTSVTLDPLARRQNPVPLAFPIFQTGIWGHLARHRGLTACTLLPQRPDARRRNLNFDRIYGMNRIRQEKRELTGLTGYGE
jgi:hypothetical protein